MINPTEYGYSSKPLYSDDIKQVTKALNDLLSIITDMNAPYKQEAFFIRSYSEQCVVKVKGNEVHIHSRYCYFNPKTEQEGSKVFIDLRYIQQSLI